MDLFEDIRTQLVLRAKRHDDEASIALKGHLLTEYLINRIIEDKLGWSRKYDRYSYSKKLDEMEVKSLLPQEIVGNLRLLNKVRNKMAHELDVIIEASEMLFFKSKNKPMIVNPKRGRYPQREYLRLLSHGVLTQLTNHMLLQLKVDPRWKSELA